MRGAATWVLLRGLTREGRHWGASFPQALRDAFPGVSVCALDLPGNGRFHKLASPASVPRMAAFCRAALQRQGIAPPYHLLAMSLGAMVAVAWAQRHPAELAGCVLINTSLRPFSPFYQRLRPGNYAALLRLALGRSPPREAEATVLLLTSRRAEMHARVLDDWVRYRLDNPVAPANALRQLLAAARYQAPPAKPLPRILILCSRGDGLVDSRCSLRLAERWGCDLVEQPDAGHDLVLDDEAWVVREVRRWVGI